MDIANCEVDMDSERMKELKAFDNTKLGVKGLVDAKIVNIPKMFIRPTEELAEDLDRPKSHTGITVIDLEGLLTDNRRRKIIVEQVQIASENLGFFQVVNHGIPVGVLDNLMAGIRKFNEQDVDAKKEFYSRDYQARTVNFNSNFDLFQTKTVGWRDTLAISMINSDHFDPNELPSACRDVSVEFTNHITELGNELFDLLSEALSLKPDHLRSIHCNEGKILGCHYYPECPEPELAIGITPHSDNSFLTIVAQDQTGGLQFLQENKYWVDAQPIPGALIVNLGDLLQLVSNDKFKSVAHRVLPSYKTRVSAAFLFAGRLDAPGTVYGPIKELTSEENPPKYREVMLSDYVAEFYAKGLADKPSLSDYRL